MLATLSFSERPLVGTQSAWFYCLSLSSCSLEPARDVMVGTKEILPPISVSCRPKDGGGGVLPAGGRPVPSHPSLILPLSCC